MYEGYVSHSVVVMYLIMPYIRHVYVLLPLVRPHLRQVYVLLPLVIPHVRHVCLDLHIVVSSKGRTTRIWSFGCGFACAIEMQCAGFRLLLDKIIVL